MCGVVGVYAKTEVAQLLFDSLTVIQHRGQDAAGIVTLTQNKFNLRKGNGLVRDVFRTRHMQRLLGNIGIGHIRYPTAGTSSGKEAQPFYVNSPFGIVLAHNGNLTNAAELANALYHEDFRHLNTDSDSEILLNVFAHELARVCHLKITKEEIFQAVQGVHKRCRGGYAVVALISGVGLLAFRDPFAIRPLVFGEKVTAQGKEIMVASESVALTSQGFSIVDDVGPGEAIFIDLEGTLHRRNCATNAQLSPCLFEFVYFARPDSVIDKIPVYQVRMNIGRKLAAQIMKEWPQTKIDAVIPIPETSRPTAIALAEQMKVDFREGFVKNRYIGRTFIMPGQAIRQKSVRQKLSIIEQEFKGKNVLLIDDSIVRGTTCQEIIQMAREAGANEVYFASAAPPIRYQNIYGIDMPSRFELVAHNRTLDEIKETIGADKLIYLNLSELTAAVKTYNPKIHQFESSVFDGIYLTGVENHYLTAVEKNRSEQAKESRLHEENVCQIDLYNDE